MKNLEIAWTLREISDLLRVKGENRFKVRAYNNAARSIKKLKEDITTLRKKEVLTEIPGIGENIAKKIEEILDTGRSVYLDELREEVPPGVLSIISLPGVGPKTAGLLYEKLQFKDLSELMVLAKDGRLRDVPGIGPKTETNILKGIEKLKKNMEHVPHGLARVSADIIFELLSSFSLISRVSLAGSMRRGKDMVGDVDFVAASDNSHKVMEILGEHPHIRELDIFHDNRAKAFTNLGTKIDLQIVKEDKFAAVLHRSTGSKKHFQQLSALGNKKGINYDGNSILKNGKEIIVSDEEGIYSAFGLPYIDPELREGAGEIEAAKNNSLPDLVDIHDLRGDLHTHSTWSDGHGTIEEMVQEAVKMGYSYLAITDHSQSLAVANGLTVGRLMEQWDEINYLRKKYAPFLILRGIEMDILRDCRLDYEDEILAKFDIVIASIHTGFEQNKEAITERLITALENPYVDIIAHPTGRILGRRPPYEVDMEKVIEKASKLGKTLEVNSSLDRLDLNAAYVRMAKEAGVKIAINTDAHGKTGLRDMEYGVMTARRGWLEKNDVLNTLDSQELLSHLSRNRVGVR
ncbi:MAG: DNA polymerase/3'-5' exonuclease PolX [Clostridia bacterium]|nr:DNA polymerase/3'-5' exonuclease PolX [Clostridia bacterium]